MRSLIRSFVMAMVGAFSVVGAVSAQVVKDVAARQRYPWNNLVDIDYAIEGATGAEPAYLRIEAEDRSTGKRLEVLSLDRPAAATNGSHRVTWDPVADGLPASTGRMVFTVSLCRLAEDPYLVVDLSGGPECDVYPLKSLAAPPAGGWTEEYKTTKLVLRRIPAGTFTMGSPPDEPGRSVDESRHEVTLTRDFYLGVFEVTQRQWELVMGTNPSSCKGDARPVECVSFDRVRGPSAGSEWPAIAAVDGESFLGRLRARTGIVGFDLPTEAQWEYACRAGTSSALNSGKGITSERGRCPNLDELGRYDANRKDGKGGHGEHTTVGSYEPNSWGLYDMHGNLAEWCLDRWPSAYGEAIVDPTGAKTGSGRVFRGGGWASSAKCCRSAYRFGKVSSDEDGGRGFRLSIGFPPSQKRAGRQPVPMSSVLASAASEAVHLRLATAPRRVASGSSIALTYSDRWDGIEGGRVTISADRETVFTGSGEGSVDWTVPASRGLVELSHSDDGSDLFVTLEIEEEAYELVVRSEVDGIVPAAGRYLHPVQTNLTFSAAPFVPIPGGGRAVCTGWTGTGSVPATGSGTNCTFTLLESSTLTWHWATNHFLSVSSSGDGTVDFADSWRPAGSTVEIPLREGPLSAGVELSGDTEGVERRGDLLIVPIDRNRALHVEFIGLTLALAVDDDLREWRTGGDFDWLPQTTTSHDTVDAASANRPAAPGDHRSYLETTVAGPGGLSFFWLATGPAGDDPDRCELLLDGTNRLGAIVCGPDGGWRKSELAIPGGIHLLRWDYRVRRANRPGSAVYLDEVVWRSEARATTTTSVPVPYDWLEERHLVLPGGDYEKAAKAAGKNGRPVWESYVLGLDPADPSSCFRTTIDMVDGRPVIESDPPGALEGRTYRIEGKEDLAASEWKPFDQASGQRFFRTTVSMP